MVAQAAAPMVTGAATYSDELQGAYEYAYSKGITTMTSIDNANMYGELTRGQLAKMISNWAESELGRTADETAVCSFTDTNTAEGDLATYVVKACQMGLMGQGITAFRPNDKVTRGEFGTTLSRAIWGDKYDGANPYYANHLAALSQEGIMTKISEPNNLEIRGWVMLMLQRAATTVAPEECKDAAVVMACALDPESDACPAACRKPAKDDEGTPSDTTVKAGDLRVTATAATDRKAVNNGDSDLDTITLKTSEALTVNSITLERFGYSSADTASVWLEDAYGNVIADSKDVSTSKDTVTLKIKKDYRTMEEGENNITTVVSLSGAQAGGTIGFKVTDIDSSAKNVDIADYKAYTYDIIGYTGSEVSLDPKGNGKEYNYEEGKFYEVSRIKVSASNAAILVNGFTLTNKATSPVSLDEFVKDLKVTVDGSDVKGLKWSVNKDNEVNISFDEIEIAINKNAQFTTSIAMENFDEYGNNVELQIVQAWDFKALEKKTGSRVSVKNANALSTKLWKNYTFNGSKIKFVNGKLSSTVDAAQGSQDTVIAKGTVTLGEEIKLSDLKITANVTGVIENMKLVIAGEEFDARSSSGNTVFTFGRMNIEKGWDVELVVDIFDGIDEKQGETVTVKVDNGTTQSALLNSAMFTGDFEGTYVDSKKPVNTKEVSGSISISKIKVQESKASLKKTNDSTTVEFSKNDSGKLKTLYKGTYTAKKWEVDLNEFAFIYSGDFAAAIEHPAKNDIEFYLYIDGEEVASADAKDVYNYSAKAEDFSGYDSFWDVNVQADKSVTIEVKADASVTELMAQKREVELYLRGTDVNWVNAGFVHTKLNGFKFVANGNLNISDTEKKSVAVQANEITLAKFTLKPAKSSTATELDNIVIDLGTSGISSWDLSIYVDEQELDLVDGLFNKIWYDSTNAADSKYAKFDGSNIDDIEDEVTVEIKVSNFTPAYLNGTAASPATVTGTNITTISVASINGQEKGSSYSRIILPAVATVASQESDGSNTTFRFNDIENFDGEEIRNIAFYTVKTDSVATTPDANSASWYEAGPVSEGTAMDITNSTNPQTVKTIYFEIYKDGSLVYKVLLQNTDVADFFKTVKDGKLGSTLQVKKLD